VTVHTAKGGRRLASPLLNSYNQTSASSVESARDFRARSVICLLARGETSVEELATGYLVSRG
jgi:hypothetical protein